MGDLRRCDERYCCRFQARAPAHHDRLLEIERYPFDGLVELIEIAATWHELEYSEGESLVEPRLWPEFAELHGWERPNRVMDLMLSLASLAQAPYRKDSDGAEDRLETSPILVSAWPGHPGHTNVPFKRIKMPPAMATVIPISATRASDPTR